MVNIKTYPDPGIDGTAMLILSAIGPPTYAPIDPGKEHIGTFFRCELANDHRQGQDSHGYQDSSPIIPPADKPGYGKRDKQQWDRQLEYRSRLEKPDPAVRSQSTVSVLLRLRGKSGS